ncbi:Endoplasmic reticulum oxidoreductin-1 [Venturia nashicola]|nr:Endoplasmic reticulum oxidoreductin-1 [Venturia nashicola]
MREDADVNQRDYTGRTPLHLAVMSSTPDTVKCLVKHGARLVARIDDGRTALHLAALRGDPEIVRIIMEKREASEAEEELKIMRGKDAKADTGKERLFSIKSRKSSRLFDEYGHYIHGLQPGCYKYWVVATGFEEAKPGTAEKQQAISDIISTFEGLEKHLLQKGAKTFEQLHPSIKCDDNVHTPFKYEVAKPKPFEASFRFAVGDLTNEKKELYLELFQAAWDGDLETIKRLILMPQGEKKDEPPLQIAVRDYADLSPFSIAVLRDHIDTAAAILEISRAHDESDDDDGASDRLEIYREVVDDTFTIKNIGEVSLQVKSSVTSLASFNWTAAIQGFDEFGPDAKRKINEVSPTLLAYAIALDKKELLGFLINLGAKYTTRKDDEGSSTPQFYSFGASELNFALDLGNTHLVSETLSLTGCGLPLDDLVKRAALISKKSQSITKDYPYMTGSKASLALIAALKRSVRRWLKRKKVILLRDGFTAHLNGLLAMK